MAASDASRVPVHVGIIMDGNGRWAKKRFMPRIMGHHAGIKAVERTVRAAKDLGIRYLSLYAFSTENWRRPEEEVSGLMGLFRHYVKVKARGLVEERARMRFAGRLGDLPADVLAILREAEEITAGGDAIDLIICLNYGGRQEILDAVSRMMAAGEKGPVDEALLRRYLYMPDVPDPDLIVRTSGELRMSNFLLWESAYSELFFTDTLWPDFGRNDLEKAMTGFASRERRYGGTRAS